MPEKGKVCIITTVHQPFDTRIFHKEARTLAKAGYQVTLIAQHDKNEIVDGINIVALPKSKNRLSRIFLSSWRAYKLALKQNADIYHFHDPEFLPWAKKLKYKKQAKIIYDVHEDYITSFQHKNYIPLFLRAFFSKQFNYFERYYSGEFHIILAEKYYRTRFPEGAILLNYPIRLDVETKTKEYHLKLDEFNKVLYTGGITIERGALIHSELVTIIPSLHVYLVGKCDNGLVELIYKKVGPDKNRLHIDGKGHIPFEKIISYYAQGNWLAGLAIFPYSEHNYQKELTKFFEYMSNGIPLIASNFPVWRSLIEGNKCGICVNPEDSEDIAKAIKYLIEHPEEAKIMGENGKKAVLEKYNWETESKKLLNLYDKLLSDTYM